MRVFVAGASGAIGTRLVPQLIDRGHEVIGTFRSPAHEGRVRALGAEPVALELLSARVTLLVFGLVVGVGILAAAPLLVRPRDAPVTAG